jgi:ABC-type transport system involved in Fe-S cluster assembly fused permease/ATPase subunit
MAPANGLAVICFNVMGLTLILTYLWMSGHRDYAIAAAVAAALYTAYLVGGIKSRIEAFRKMKALAAESPV